MSIVGDLLGAGQQRRAINDANRIQAESTDKANTLLDTIDQRNRADNLPALQAGNTARSQLMQLLGLGGDAGAANFGQFSGVPNVGDVQTEPGYQFGLNQGMKTLQQSAAARGGLYSGQAMKAANQFGNDYGTTKYNDAFSRILNGRNSAMQPLLSLAGAGQGAANTLAQSGMNYGNTAGNNLTSLGNSQAAGALAKGNQLTNLLNKWEGQAMSFGSKMYGGF